MKILLLLITVLLVLSGCVVLPYPDVGFSDRPIANGKYNLMDNYNHHKIHHRR